MEERLSKLEEEVKFLRDLNRDLIERVIFLHSNQASSAKAFEQISERVCKLSETLEGFESSQEAKMQSFVLNQIVPNVSQILRQQEQDHHNEIKFKHQSWFDEYREKLQNNQLLWTGFLSLLLTIIILGMFTFLATILATITDFQTRSIIDKQMNRVESKIQGVESQQRLQSQKANH